MDAIGKSGMYLFNQFKWEIMDEKKVLIADDWLCTSTKATHIGGTNNLIGIQWENDMDLIGFPIFLTKICGILVKNGTCADMEPCFISDKKS